MAHLAYRAALEDHGVRIYLSSEVRKITESSVTVCGPGGEFSLEADTVVYAVGREPLDDEANSLHGCAPEFYLAGDCMTPDNIMAATKVAFAAANNIGRM
jgi:pyruvate/2-oxoglutarate dehydrogenase complex dihydrolipoamide dehydrogenase (E3) component